MKPRLLVVPIALLLGSLLTAKDSNAATAHPPADSSRVQVKVLQKNNIRLYPNPTTNGVVSISSHTPGKIYFYIFDLEGEMVHQSQLENRQKVTVRELKKGIYVYDVFRNDMSIERGKIIVK